MKLSFATFWVGLAVLIGLGTFSIVSAGEPVNEDSISADAELPSTDCSSGRICHDNRDCMPATEHCVRGRCELKSTRCWNNFDCSFPQHCINGACR